jgi:hypothetical protein
MPSRALVRRRAAVPLQRSEQYFLLATRLDSLLMGVPQNSQNCWITTCVCCLAFLWGILLMREEVNANPYIGLKVQSR